MLLSIKKILSKEELENFKTIEENQNEELCHVLCEIKYTYVRFSEKLLCPYCSELVSSAAASFRNHVCKHGLKTKFYCSFCKCSTFFIEHLYKHLRENNSHLAIISKSSSHDQENESNYMLNKDNSNKRTIADTNEIKDKRQRSSLYDHNNKTDNKIHRVNFQCHFCQYLSSDIEFFKIHFSKYHANHIFSIGCEHCNYSCQTILEFTDHVIANHHLNILQNELFYSDPVKINKDFQKIDEKSEQILSTHLTCKQINIQNNYHIKSDFQKCPYCLAFTSQDIEMFRNHMLNDHALEIIFQCFLCHFRTTSSEILLEHLQDHKNTTILFLPANSEKQSDNIVNNYL